MKKLDRAGLRDLRDFVNGTYIEIDKLARKSPERELSDFATQRVNRALRDTKSMLAGHDKYAADLAEFVPAGDNPEARDAVLALREALQALDRAIERLPFDPLGAF